VHLFDIVRAVSSGKVRDFCFCLDSSNPLICVYDNHISIDLEIGSTELITTECDGCDGAMFRVSLVPVFGFGENDLYQQVANPPGSRLRRLQTMLTKILSFSPPLFHGRGVFNYTFGILPFRRPVNVIGKFVHLICVTIACQKLADSFSKTE